jgi:MscS family membrane protein
VVSEGITAKPGTLGNERHLSTAAPVGRMAANPLTSRRSFLQSSAFMKRVFVSLIGALVLHLATPAIVRGQEDDTPTQTDASAAMGEPSPTTSTTDTTNTPPATGVTPADRQHDLATAAVAAAAAEKVALQHPRRPDLLEHLVDVILELFNVSSSGNTPAHYAISVLFLVAALLARRIVTGIVFVQLKKLAAKTETTLDDKLFPALEAPAAALVMVTGIFAALKVLKLSEQSDAYINNGSTVAFSLVIFWGLWRALGALLDHGHEVALQKGLGIAGFMPWIKKTIFSVFIVVGVLLIVQNLGYDVKALLAGLGIGGLAFALAAQDTLANVFGSIVVAIDQPFKIGEAVKIGGNVGTVEDIGMRSTRIRLVDKSLMIIPNKTVAAETITNFSRFTRRRIEQVIGLTYDSKPEQLEAIVDELRELIRAQPEVDKNSVMVFFRDFSASSLDLWVVYETADPDFQKSMRLRQRVNLAIMRTLDTRRLSMAFPTQTIQLDGPVARQLGERKD